MNINEIKELLVWCRSNGVYHIEAGEFKADIQLLSEEAANPKPLVVVHDEIPHESPDYGFPEYEEIKPFLEPEEAT